MQKPRTTSGLDLHLVLVGSGRRESLERALRDAVRSGRLAPGARLPSTRALARDLGVARNTVVEAYGLLAAEGWLTSRPGSATRVAAHAFAPRPEPAVAGPGARPVRFDLRPGAPDLASFPRRAWTNALQRALQEASPAALGYPPAQGLVELRRALADYLGRARGVDAAADRIVVCSGFAQGLEIACRLLGGTTVALEAFGHRRHREIVETATGMPAATLPVDDGGAVVGRLRETAAGAVLLTPAHQFPLGVPLAPERRMQVIEWAREAGGVVIEDDYDGEFRYDRRAVGALQALAPEHVIYAGTASKTLAPGLRLGWLVLPARLIGDVSAVREVIDGPSALDQLALAELLGNGGYDRHVRRCRLSYRQRHDRLVAAISGVPGARVRGVAAGLQALIDLPPGRTEAEVIASAAARGLTLNGLASFARDATPHAPALVAGYATPPAHAFSGAVARLVATLRDVASPTGGPRAGP
jgi:GntR family transcriptional regulator/MocR family aminotransferase